MAAHKMGLDKMAAGKTRADEMATVKTRAQEMAAHKQEPPARRVRAPLRFPPRVWGFRRAARSK